MLGPSVNYNVELCSFSKDEEDEFFSWHDIGYSAEDFFISPELPSLYVTQIINAAHIEISALDNPSVVAATRICEISFLNNQVNLHHLAVSSSLVW